MIYLITGGNSFLGMALSRCLLAEGHDVIIACRESSKCDVIGNDHLRIVRYKGLEDIKAIESKVSHADVFIHLAWGGTDKVGRNSKDVQEKNIAWSMEALTVAKAIGCQLFVEAGSQAEYGIVKTLITEETPCNPVIEYGKAKRKFGNKAQVWCDKNNIKFIHLRIFSIYGVHDHESTLVMSCIKKMLANEDVQLSSCRQMWNFVSEDDAARQIYLLTKYATDKTDFKSEIYHIASRDTRCLRSFVEEMRILTASKSHLSFADEKSNTVTLDPNMDKTEKATEGFVSSETFGDVVKHIINRYLNKNQKIREIQL